MSRILGATAVHKIFEDSFYRNWYTDDLPEISKTNHYLFTYGTLKHKFPRGEILNACPLIGVGYTKLRNFVMHRTVGDDSFPIIHSHNIFHQQGAIFGEVYIVDPKTLVTIDQIEQNGKMFERKKIDIELATHGSTVSAWVYMGVKKFWQKNNGTRVVLCDRQTLASDPGKHYYSFMKRYLNA